MVVIRRPDHRNRWRTRIVVGNVRNAFIFLVTSYYPLCAIFKLAATRILHLGLGWWVWGYFFSISLMTLVVYGGDKQSSEMGGWRTPERNLHALELLGGWMAAFVAQLWFRHKTQKVSYQIVFWSIALFHQYLALHYLNEWLYAMKLLNSVIGLFR
jgi:uncharacterized membrane protein YsdA (DUF1294 family)